jgi:hypothetical protein
MHIQINSPHESLPEAFVELVERTAQAALAPQAKRLTRLEIHFQDLNAQKGGIDKRCLIEARPKGLKPVAADHESETVGDAFHGALEKLQRVLEHRFGRLDSQDQGR